MSEKKSCFVVTPIGDENTAIRRHIDGIIDQAIIPAIGDEFEIKVAHREYEIGSINDRVIQSVCNSDLVVANLTGLNPNVMFEIAIRYSFGKPAIVIAEKGTKLPFDIVDENTIFYINDPAGAAELKETIKKFVQKIDWSKCEYGPVFSAIKNAAVVTNIEMGISGEENKNAFSFLVDKINKIENELQRNYISQFEYSDNNNLIRHKVCILANELKDILVKEGDVLSSSYIEDLLSSKIIEFSLEYNKKAGLELIGELKRLLKDDERITKNLRSRVMNILGKIQNKL